MLPPPRFNHFEVLIEVVYSLIVSLSCFFIYFKTKELYELTSYRGLKYFRNTFLFFGISFLIRLLLHFVRPFERNPFLLRPLSMLTLDIAFFIMVYCSSMALIYIIYSVLWKKLDKKWFSKTYLFHTVSILLAMLSVILRTPVIIFIFQAMLFISLIVLGYHNYKKGNNKNSFSHLYLIYILIFALGIISNTLEFVSIFSPIVAIAIYVASIIVFLIMLFRVAKRLNS